MNRTATLAMIAVGVNLLVAYAHGQTHAHAEVPLQPWQLGFVQVTVYLLPLVAAVLYWTPLQRAGGMLLMATMLASLIFGIFFHFLADTVDHVSHRDHSTTGMLFILTALLLIPAEAFGVWVGYRTWILRKRGQNELSSHSP